VTLEGSQQPSQELSFELKQHVVQEIGAIARPGEIRFTDLAQTRSKKSCGGCSGHWLLVRKFLATPPP